MNLRKLLLPILLVGAAAAGYYYWLESQPASLPEGIASSNGRVEAVEIDLATKIGGRLVEVMVNEGDFVTAGQEVARMDTASLEAQWKQAKAELERAKTSVESSQSSVRQRESNKEAAEAVVLQRDAELKLATNNADRAEKLERNNAASQEEAETKRAEFFKARIIDSG